MAEVSTRHVSEDEDGIRLDRWFKRHFPHLTHARLEKLLRTGQVRIDGQRAKANARLSAGQAIRVPPLEAATSTAVKAAADEREAQFVRGLVLHEAKDFFVINKPAGLASQGGSGTTRHLDGLLAYLADKAGNRPRLVHRLDRDTSGLMIVAKKASSAAKLGRLFQSRAVSKVYWALTHEAPSPLAGTIDMPLIKRGARGDERMFPAEEGEEGLSALTHYAVVAGAEEGLTWIALSPVTGRTHQIRVHLAEIGFPIVGDPKYGIAAQLPEGVAPKLHLHARQLILREEGGRILTFTAPLSEPMRTTWRRLGFKESDAEGVLDRFLINAG